MSARRSLSLCAAGIALASASWGCSGTSSCSRDEEHVDVFDGWVSEDKTFFSSADPTKLPLLDAGELPDDVPGPTPYFTYFPANRSITFHIGLSGYPTTITPYLSFRKEGDSTIAPCAGNQCLIRKRSKDVIVLRNDTCSEFWVWLTASTSATPFHELSDAGVDEGAAGASGASGTQ